VLTKLAMLDEPVLEQLAADAFVFAFDAHGQPWQWNGERFELEDFEAATSESDMLEPKSLGQLEAA
jgi:hypothetical protein